MNIRLFQLDKRLKKLLVVYLITVTCGLGIGLVYLAQNTGFSAEGTVEHYNGSATDVTGELDIPEKFPKPLGELLMTTHNHVLGLSFLFLSISLIFYFSSIVNSFWKTFLMIEPLISVMLTFGSIWGMRFIHSAFVYLTILSAILMYSAVFIMIFLSAYELLFMKNKHR